MAIAIHRWPDSPNTARSPNLAVYIASTTWPSADRTKEAPRGSTIEDPNDTGVDDDLMVMCEHGKPDAKLVAFEVISTGRRFLACSLDQANNCGIVQWVHEEWPEHLQNALHKLWLMYEQSKHDNRIACLDHSSTVHNLTQQKISCRRLMRSLWKM
ncbi:hypothetical protein ZWY2020_054725 [Hordeum vulgare]|nr:hypothetical protein ZWY2020_054725 [Hordeum vulgare]